MRKPRDWLPRKKERFNGRPKLPRRKRMTKEEVGLVQGYKSGLERVVAAQIEEKYGFSIYEPIKVYFTQPAKKRFYKPDFILPNGTLIETKGRFTLLDRQKHLYIKNQYPHLEIRFVFTNPNALLRKGAKTTYAQWCDKYGYKYARGKIPEEWM